MPKVTYCVNRLKRKVWVHANGLYYGFSLAFASEWKAKHFNDDWLCYLPTPHPDFDIELTEAQFRGYLKTL